MIVPFGALPGFSLAADIREVASYYGVEVRALGKADGRTSHRLALARHALMWKLLTQRGLTPKQVALHLSTSRSRVQEGAKLHQKRIDEFRSTSGVVVPPKGGQANG